MWPLGVDLDFSDFLEVDLVDVGAFFSGLGVAFLAEHTVKRKVSIMKYLVQALALDLIQVP